MRSEFDPIGNFVRESNMIEGIRREPTEAECAVMEAFMELERLTVEDVVAFVKAVQPNAILRDDPKVSGVRVGNHVAPKSGIHIRERLEKLLIRAADPDGSSPYDVHQHYEHLHPFTDGNGRSGRAIWAWSMNKLVGADSMDVIWARGFLHSWYYQSLSEWRRV